MAAYDLDASEVLCYALVNKRITFIQKIGGDLMKIKSCQFNDDTGNIDIIYSEGTKISLNCSEIEKELDTTIKSRAKLDWLIFNEPLTYAELVINGNMQDYLNSIDKSYNDLEDNIRRQLEKKFPKNIANDIAREFMMYGGN